MNHRKTIAFFALALFTIVGGCGAKEDDVTPFVGTWTAVSGTYQEPCNDGTTTSGALVATLVLGKGTDSDLMTPAGSDGCRGKLNVDGSVATYVTGICGIENTLMGTFTLEADHDLADVDVSETWTYPTKTCQMTVQGTYQKN